MSQDKEYERIWAQHQAFLKEVEQISHELQAAEAARNAAMQPSQPDAQQQSNLAELEAKVEQLRAKRDEAIQQVSEYQFQVIRETGNPQYGQWLEEQQPPTPDNKSKEAYIDVALTLAEIGTEKAKLMASFGGSPVTDPIKQGVEYAREHKDAVIGYAAGWVQDKIDTVKEYIAEKPPEKENAIEAVADNYSQQVVIDEGKELRTNFDKEYKDMYDRHEKEFKELSEKQYAEIKGSGEQTPEMAAKFQEQHKELKDKQMKEFADIETRECKEKADLILKEWKNDIGKAEKDVNDKFDKKLEDTEKALQKQSDQIEKRLSGNEKDDKIKLLKEIETKEKNNIEEMRAGELKNIEERKANLEQVKEAAKKLEEKERLKEIERQRELERQRQLEEHHKSL